ncbi:LPS export ABC transporter periplasmic protein LptC [Ideonella sp.]|uniref:LPS export ABC transporter periplasmic protein LptC n=1 Tax=Ideonella sp. TaxID=1929293 RepID=UPI0035AD8E95
MKAELHLPDLPEVPVAIGAPDPAPAAAPAARGRREAWSVRLRQGLGTYLPLMLMCLLAVATWWLVRYAPRPAAETAPAVVRHVPDYTAQRAVLQRFNAQGRLVAQVEGEQVRHFPDTDEVEVDTVRVSATAEDGRRTEATARQAVAAGDQSVYRLEGQARVVSTAADGRTVVIEGEQLQLLATQRRVRADRPVVVRQGGSAVMADRLLFDEATQTLTLSGRVRAVLQPGDVRGRAVP